MYSLSVLERLPDPTREPMLAITEAEVASRPVDPIADNFERDRVRTVQRELDGMTDPIDDLLVPSRHELDLYGLESPIPALTDKEAGFT